MDVECCSLDIGQSDVGFERWGLKAFLLGNNVDRAQLKVASAGLIILHSLVKHFVFIKKKELFDLWYVTKYWLREMTLPVELLKSIFKGVGGAESDTFTTLIT